jgi:hypothetical protein
LIEREREEESRIFSVFNELEDITPVEMNDTRTGDREFNGTINMTANGTGTGIVTGGGRKVSEIWSYFNNCMNPHREMSSICKYCQLEIRHSKKSERVIKHLKECLSFKQFLQK